MRHPSIELLQCGGDHADLFESLGILIHELQAGFAVRLGGELQLAQDHEADCRADRVGFDSRPVGEPAALGVVAGFEIADDRRAVRRLASQET